MKKIAKGFFAFIATALILFVGACLWAWDESVTPPEVGNVAREVSSAPVSEEWTEYGGTSFGQKYSPLSQINRANVAQLQPAWTFSTKSVDKQNSEPRLQKKKMAYEVTPIMVDKVLYLCDPFDQVFALNPKTGEQIWKYDPKIDGEVAYDHLCRGVATWRNLALADSAVCARRIYIGTTDARLIALDAKTGTTCPDFGTGGTVNLKAGMGDLHPGEYYMTSPPTVVGRLVVTGALIADNWRADGPSGVIRAFDAQSGQLVWAWDAAPPNYQRPASETGQWARGTPNSWAIFSADPDNDMIFIPTGNPSLDLYGGLRRQLDYYGSSVVALQASTGRYLWHFQTVHHDLWDYDVPSQPSLFNLKTKSGTIAAIAQATKAGHVFILDRKTGKPLFPVEERPVPQSTVAGESTSPTQPFPLSPPPLYPDMEKVLGNPFCIGGKRHYRADGIFTPPSLEGSITYPGPLGGSDWGGVAIDEPRQILVLNQSVMPIINKLVQRQPGQPKFPEVSGESVGNFDMTGAPYFASRSTLTNFAGLPCMGDPAGEIIAINLTDGSVRWRRPLGRTALIPGSLNAGGPLVTAGGLVFIGAALDSSLFPGFGAKFRAFDIETGKLVWVANIPTQASATPMSYAIDGAQYIVVAVGGHGVMKAKSSDMIMAYRLK